MNFNEMIANLPAWAFAGDEQALRVAPQWVRRAENRLFRDLDRDAFRTTVPGTLVAGDGRVDLRLSEPIEIRRWKVVIDDTDVVLLARNLEFLEALFADRLQLGEPSFYAELAEHGIYQLFMTPELAWDYEVIVTRRPALLDRNNATGILTDRFSNLLDLECWRQAALFKRDLDMADRYERDYQTELTSANAEVARGKRDDSQTRPRDTTNRAGV